MLRFHAHLGLYKLVRAIPSSGSSLHTHLYDRWMKILLSAVSALRRMFCSPQQCGPLPTQIVLEITAGIPAYV